jgi:hypothetical protein
VRGRTRDGNVEAVDELPRHVVKLELCLLAKLQDFCCSEAPRVRGDAKAVAGGKRLASRQIGGAERMFKHDRSPMRDGDDSAWLLRHAHLEFDPARDVIERAAKPPIHRYDLSSARRTPLDCTSMILRSKAQTTAVAVLPALAVKALLRGATPLLSPARSRIAVVKLLDDHRGLIWARYGLQSPDEFREW